MMRACWILLSTIALTRSTDADACSCALEPPTLSPSDQATDVPRNTLVVARAVFFDQPSIELRVVDTNELVPVILEQRQPDQSTWGHILFARPATPLAAHTRYVATFHDVTSDADTTAMFTTSDALDTTPPAFSGLTSLSLETMTYPISSCFDTCLNEVDGHISRIRLGFADPPPDAVYVAVELSHPGEPAIDELPIPTYDPHLLGFDGCDTRAPSLDLDSDYCVRVVAYDVAGNRSGQDAEACGTTQRCKPTGPTMSNGEICEPSAECLPDDGEPPGLHVDSPEGGCSTSSASALAAVALLGLRRKRRHQGTFST